MKFSALYQTYDAMREPNYALKVGGKSLDVGDDARLFRVECGLTCTRQAGFLTLEAALDPEQEHGAAWLDAFQPGAMCSFSIGYGKHLTEVFCGFLYDVLWSDPLQGTVMLAGGFNSLCERRPGMRGAERDGADHPGGGGRAGLSRPSYAAGAARRGSQPGGGWDTPRFPAPDDRRKRYLA